jgi:hypothetical protein
LDNAGNNNNCISATSDLDRIRAIRAMADTGDLRALENLLPFSGYKTRVSLTAARNAVISILSQQCIGECPLEKQSRETLERITGLLDATCQMWKGKNVLSINLLARAVQKLYDDGHTVRMDLSYTREGMFLAGTVVDSSGTVIVENGTQLINSLLRKIHMAKIPWIEVRKSEKAETGITPSASAIDQKAQPDPLALELNRRFSGHEQNPMMMKIRDAALNSLKINVVGIQRAEARL